jgi:hypothetical protein
MSRLVPSLTFIFALAATSVAAARAVDREDFRPWSVAVQQAQAQQPGRDVLDKGKEAVGAAADSVRAKPPLTPELKALRDDMAERVEELRAVVNKKYDEAGAKVASYALWAAAGLFTIMVLASVLGGVIVALIFRRIRNA